MEAAAPKYSIGDPELASRRFGILKALNIKNANIERFKKSIAYVTNPAATNKSLQYYSRLSKEHPADALNAISERFHKAPDTRLFKHFVFSYGDYWLEEKAMMEFTEIIMNHLSGNEMFPYMFALHTNTKHPHSHALLCCTSLVDGHQFSQSASDLERFKDFYDEVATEKKFPLLLRKKNKRNDSKKEVVTINADGLLKSGTCNTEYNMYYGPQNAAYGVFNRVICPVPVAPEIRCNSEPLQSNNSPAPETVETDPGIKRDLSLTKVWDDYRNDCKEYFVMGLKIGLGLESGGNDHGN